MPKRKVGFTEPKKQKKSKNKETFTDLNQLLISKSLENCPIKLADNIINEDSLDSVSSAELDRKYYYENLIKFKILPLIVNQKQ